MSASVSRMRTSRCMALGQEPERSQLVLGEQVLYVRIGQSMCPCSISAPMRRGDVSGVSGPR
ncbi:hypothetical protein DBP19_36855 [Streptomyces sp. CS090A]|nr:hypothetical protein DBP19_36855 [Streptomyces sp. CS090A]